MLDGSGIGVGWVTGRHSGEANKVGTLMIRGYAPVES